jgi:biopolymer transport protein ExbB
MKIRPLILVLLFCSFAIALIAPAFSQETRPPIDAKGAAASEETTTTMWQDLKAGGPTMIIIGICSVATMYLIIDGLLRITNFKKMIPEMHVRALKGLFRSGDYVGAHKFCKNNPSPLTNVCRAGLAMAGEGKAATEEAIVAEVSKENARMQYFISYLSVIGVCTPMIGLLGTVFGMKSAFRTLGVSGVGDPSKLSGAIGEVLICTALGLLIAIPAFFSFYWLRNRSAKGIHDIQETISALYRKMPYEYLAGAQVGDEELFAALPNWVQPAAAEPQAGVAPA